MYENFFENRLITSRPSSDNDWTQLNEVNPQFNQVTKSLSGKQIENGLFTFMWPEESKKWSNLMASYFNFQNMKLLCFAFDWSGKVFALNSIDDGFIYCLDPATFEWFELETGVEDFLNIELVDSIEELLEWPRFRNFMRTNSLLNLKDNYCVGFKKPLFLGGEDDDENFELTEMEVYWGLNHELLLSILKKK